MRRWPGDQRLLVGEGGHQVGLGAALTSAYLLVTLRRLMITGPPPKFHGTRAAAGHRATGASVDVAARRLLDGLGVAHGPVASNGAIEVFGHNRNRLLREGIEPVEPQGNRCRRVDVAVLEGVGEGVGVSGGHSG